MNSKHSSSAKWLTGVGLVGASIGVAAFVMNSGEETPTPRFKERTAIETASAPADTNRTARHLETVGTLPGPEPLPTDAHSGDPRDIRTVSGPAKPLGSKGQRSVVRFLNGEFVPPKGERIQPGLSQLASDRDFVYGMVLLDRRMEDLKHELERIGVEPLRFYPTSAYTVRIPSKSLAALSRVTGVLWVGEPNHEQKLDPQLYTSMNMGSGVEQELYVCLFDDSTSETERAFMQSIGARVGNYYKSLATFYVRANSAKISQILNRNGVLFVEPVMPNHALHGESQTTINSDRLWGVHDGAPEPGITEVPVGVMDTGFNINHSDFASIIGGTIGINFTGETTVFTDGHGHGTHVLGSFLGEGNANLRYRGAAPGIQDTNFAGYDLAVSKVFNSAGNSVGTSVNDGFNYLHVTRPRRVLNYSGGGYSGSPLVGTDTNSRKVDEMFEDNILCVIAAGNDGSGVSTINSPGVAKGAFTVGNIYDNNEGADVRDTIRASSSRGPTGDGRIKPDVVAPGAYIDSTHNTNDTGYLFGWTGTSMASPHVAGSAASLFAHYQWPVRAIKAVMMATALNLPGLGSNDEGSGKIDRLSMHYALADSTWSAYYGTAGATGTIDYVDIVLPAGVSQLRVVMLYADPPATAGAGSALVHDLDLYVDTGVLTTTAGGEFSSLSVDDNVERITITSPAAGTIRVKVYAYSNSGSRPWAFCVKRWEDPNLSPLLATSVTAPVAVQPGDIFTVTGTVSNSEHIASAVHGDIDFLDAVFTLNGTTVRRRSPAGTTETFFLSGDDGTNQGDIGPGYSRSLDFSVTANAGTADGTYQVRYDADPTTGTTSSTVKDIIIDGTAPTNWQNFSPSGYTYDLTPTCSMQARDVLAGLDVSTAQYRYSINGGVSYSAWLGASCTGVDGTTAFQTITAANVPFNQASGSLNRIQFRIYDRAGNLGTSPSQDVNIGATVEHTGWSTGPGSTTSGSHNDLFLSDDVRWLVRPGAILIATQDPVSIVLSGTAPTASPVNIRVVLESSATATGIRQIVEAYNFTSSSYTVLETFVGLPTGASPDRQTILTIPNPTQHKSAAHLLQVRMRYKNTTAVLVYPWNVRLDRLYWLYDPS